MLRARMARNLPSRTSLTRDSFGGVRVSLHPAGHILGSAQVRVESAARSGSSRATTSRPRPHLHALRARPLPHLRHRIHVRPADLSLADARSSRAIQSLVAGEPGGGASEPSFGYPSARRSASSRWPRSASGLFLHGAVERLNAVYRATASLCRSCGGHRIAASPDRRPSRRHGTPWLRRFGPASTAFASGWMRIRGTRRRRSLDRGFVLSDHADWPALLERHRGRPAPRRSGSRTVYRAVVRWLEEQGRRPLPSRRCPRMAKTVVTGEPEARPNESLRRPLHRARRDHQDHREGRGADALLRRRPARDAAWAVYFLIGRRPKRLLESRKLAHWAIEEAGIPDWLFDESYDAVGDLAETIALLLPPADAVQRLPLHDWVEERLLPLRNADDDTRRASLRRGLARDGRPPAVRLEQAHHRRVPRRRLAKLVVRALAEVSGIAPAVIAHRLMGDWEPTPDFWRNSSPPTPATPTSAARTRSSSPIRWKAMSPKPRRSGRAGRPSGSGTASARSSIRRAVADLPLVARRGAGHRALPRARRARRPLPDGTVIDGEILPWKDGAPLPFAQLQRRIGRKTLGTKILAEVPVVLMAYDLLELERRGRPRASARVAARAACRRIVAAATCRAGALARRRRAAPGTTSPQLAPSNPASARSRA